MVYDDAFLKKCTQILVQELPTLRKMNNLTQKDLGDILGVSRQTITNIESGKTEMKLIHFWAIMYVFSLSSDSLEYLKKLDIPYKELKMWLIEKKG